MQVDRTVCGPAKPGAAGESLGTIRSSRYVAEGGLYTTGAQIIVDGGLLNGLEVGQNLVARRYYRVSAGVRGAAAEALARDHDHRLKKGALVEAAERTLLRHAFEVRHESYFQEEFYDLLRRYRFAFVIADTAGKFSYAEHVTAGFVYVRLHGSGQLYVGRYEDEQLEAWADKTVAWSQEGRDVYVYFDNDARGHAPHDAQRLARRVAARLGAPAAPAPRATRAV